MKRTNVDRWLDERMSKIVAKLMRTQDEFDAALAAMHDPSPYIGISDKLQASRQAISDAVFETREE